MRPLQCLPELVDSDTLLYFVFTILAVLRARVSVVLFSFPAEVEVLSAGGGLDWRSQKETIRGSAPMKLLRQGKHQFEVSESPLVKRTREVREAFNNKVEDFQESLETSQHPMLWKLR